MPKMFDLGSKPHFWIYEFVWAETLQKVFSHILAHWEKSGIPKRLDRLFTKSQENMGQRRQKNVSSRPANLMPAVNRQPDFRWGPCRAGEMD